MPFVEVSQLSPRPVTRYPFLGALRFLNQLFDEPAGYCRLKSPMEYTNPRVVYCRLKAPRAIYKPSGAMLTHWVGDIYERCCASNFFERCCARASGRCTHFGLALHCSERFSNEHGICADDTRKLSLQTLSNLLHTLALNFKLQNDTTTAHRISIYF